VTSIGDEPDIHSSGAFFGWLDVENEFSAPDEIIRIALNQMVIGQENAPLTISAGSEAIPFIPVEPSNGTCHVILVIHVTVIRLIPCGQAFDPDSLGSPAPCIIFQLELNFLPGSGRSPLLYQAGTVDEDIWMARLFNEAVTFVAIEPLDFAGRQDISSFGSPELAIRI